MALNEKQSKFVDEYFNNRLNGTKAAMKVYNAKTYESAAAMSSRLLKNVKVKEEIERRKEELQDKSNVKKEEIIRELIDIINADLCDYVQIVEKERIIPKVDIETGEIVEIKETYYDTIFTPTEQLTKEQRKLIKSIKQTRTGIEIQLYEKDKAIDTLNKMLGFSSETLNVNSSVDTSFLQDISTDELREMLEEIKNE
jgi:phage terminase small subunit